MGKIGDGELRKVKMLKLDDIVAEKKLADPYLLKIDAHGAELDVLEGSLETLKKTELVSLEVSMFKFMKEAPEFYDVVYYMKHRNFVAYDIILALVGTSPLTWVDKFDDSYQVSITTFEPRIKQHDHIRFKLVLEEVA